MEDLEVARKEVLIRMKWVSITLDLEVDQSKMKL